GNQQTSPKRTGFRIGNIVRSIGEASNAIHRLDGSDPLGQLSQRIEVTLRRDVGRRDAQNELAAGGKAPVDFVRFLKLWIVRRKEEVLIDVGCQIDEGIHEDEQDEGRGEYQPVRR